MALRTSVIPILLLAAGCQAPWIQTPTLIPGNPATERASYTQHDPLPDSSLGPNVSGRPREAFIQRGEPRRTMEASMPAMIQSGGTGNMAPAFGEYPGTVAP